MCIGPSARPNALIAISTRMSVTTVSTRISLPKRSPTELAWFAAQSPDRIVTSIFFGGGTPSLMPPAMVGLLLDRIASLWADSAPMSRRHSKPIRRVSRLKISAAIAPPASIASRSACRRSTLKACACWGASTASMKHSPPIAWRRRFSRARPSTSFMRGPARPTEAWAAELSQALAEQQGHMSLYQLTIEPDTAFARLQGGRKARSAGR